jgi:hypothetical protein
MDTGAIEPVKLWVTEINAEDGEATLEARFQDNTTKAAKHKAKRKNLKRAGTARKRSGQKTPGK